MTITDLMFIALLDELAKLADNAECLPLKELKIRLHRAEGAAIYANDLGVIPGDTMSTYFGMLNRYKHYLEYMEIYEHTGEEFTKYRANKRLGAIRDYLKSNGYRIETEEN